MHPNFNRSIMFSNRYQVQSDQIDQLPHKDLRMRVPNKQTVRQYPAIRCGNDKSKTNEDEVAKTPESTRRLPNATPAIYY